MEPHLKRAQPDPERWQVSRVPIRWKLPLLACGLPLLVAGTILWAAYREVRQSALDVAEQRMNGVLTTVTTRAAAGFRAAERAAHDLVSAPAVIQFFQDPTPANRLAAWQALATVRPRDGSTFLLQLLDARATPLATDPDTGSGAPALTVDALADIVASPDSAGLGPVQPYQDAMAYPLVALVARGRVSLGYLVLWQRLSADSGETAVLAQLAGSGVDLYLGSASGVWAVRGREAPRPALDSTRFGMLQQYERPGVGMRLAVAGQVAGSPWLLVLESSETTVLAPARQFLGRMSTAALVVGLLGLVAGLVVSRQITSPLRQLTVAAETMSGGTHEVRVAVGGDDELGRLAAVFNQMAERVDAEVAARAHAEEQWRLLFGENPHPMWVFDRETLRFLAVNNAALGNYGFSRAEFLAMTIDQLRPPEEPDSGSVGEPESRQLAETVKHRRQDGKIRDVEIRTQAVVFDGRPACLVLAQDITARLVLEASFRQAQKMEAVGRLAGGIAHDFNNLLAVIMTYTELVREDLPASDPRSADLEMVSDAADRAHALTRQLLAFSRQQILQPAVLDPNQAVIAVELLLRRLLGEDIIVDLQLDSTVGRMRIDPGQFEQVLLNLAVNARDAMPAGGSLTISTAPVEVDEASQALHGLPRPGRFVMISVADSGVGMTAETKARIFEPFFTTKEVGKGTGLGLATVYGIVTQAEGSVTLYSEVGMGATFRIYLPEVLTDPDAVLEPGPPEAAPGGSETILLVEDDPAVRSAAATVLERLGYAVLSAQGAEEALALLARHGSAIRLVISDVVMPSTDGPALLDQIWSTYPDVRALLMSGYTGDIIAKRGVLQGRIAFLEKPFTAAVLGRKVREVLEHN